MLTVAKTATMGKQIPSCISSILYENTHTHAHIINSQSYYAADRAKSIKTQATVNESPTDKLIRELREENAKLLEMIKKGNYQITEVHSGASEEGA